MDVTVQGDGYVLGPVGPLQLRLPRWGEGTCGGVDDGMIPIGGNVGEILAFQDGVDHVGFFDAR